MLFHCVQTEDVGGEEKKPKLKFIEGSKDGLLSPFEAEKKTFV